MKTISLKIDDDVIAETDRILSEKKKSRNQYINEAIDFYNKLQNRRWLANQLSKESKIVRTNSLEVLSEFERLRDED